MYILQQFKQGAVLVYYAALFC